MVAGARLRRRDELELTLHAEGLMMLRTPHGVLECSHFGMAVLDAFSQPRSVQEALDVLAHRTTGREDWMEMASVIVRFREAQVLVDEDRTSSSAASHSGFSSPAEHVSMLNDTARTLSFIHALREIVGPDDVVVEIGAGTGVLSMAAARAGARRVFAIEGTAAADWVERNIVANGLSDRTQVLRGWSTELELPERADVLVTETIGNDPLEEGILEWVIDARHRLLTEDARIVPRRLRLFAVALRVPEEVVARGQFQATSLAQWGADYGLDFSSMLAVAGNEGFYFQASQQDVARWQAASEPVVIADLDLSSVEVPFVDATAVAPAIISGQANAAILWFDLELSDSHRLHRPWDSPDALNSWLTPVWVMARPVEVTPGVPLTFRYRYRVAGVPRQQALQVSRNRTEPGSERSDGA